MRRRAGLLFSLVAFAAGSQDGSVTVLVLRHCPRTPYFCDRHPPPAPDSSTTCADNYTARPFPSVAEWGAPQGQCTAAGLQAAKELGGALRPLLPAGPVRVLADSSQRCVDTADALGLNSSAVEVNQPLFDPLSAKLESCTQPDWDASIKEQLSRRAGQLQRARATLPALQALLGQGAARPLDQIPDSVVDGYFVGGLRVASELIVESFILERGSSLPVAWGQLSSEQLVDFQAIHAAYFAAMYGGTQVVQRYGSGTLAAVLESFKAATPQATILAGHDTTTIAVAALLGLEWQCGPWAPGGTTPLSGFQFTLEKGRVQVQAVCHTFGSGSPLAMSPVRFANGQDSMDLAAFEDLVRQVTLWSCVKGKAGGSEPPAPLMKVHI